MTSVNTHRGFEKKISLMIGRIVNLQFFRPVFLIAIILILLTGVSSARNTLIILNSSDPSTMSQNIDYIESFGGNMTHRFPPDILIGDIPADKISKIKGHLNIVDIATEPVDVSLLKGYGKTAGIAVDIWNNN